MTKILRGLFVLGCASLAKNRMVVRELEVRLRGEGEEHLNELAQQELESLMAQLNEQRDILERQERLGTNQREQAELIAQNRGMIQGNREKNIEQDAELTRQRNKDIEHDNELARQREKDIEHDHLLSELVERMAKLESVIVPLWLKAVVLLNLLLAAISIGLVLAR